MRKTGRGPSPLPAAGRRQSPEPATQRLFNALTALAAVAVTLAAIISTPGAADATIGGGGGGTTGGAIWAEAWWDGSPLGPGPYIPGPAGGAPVCIWHDLGGAVSELNNGLSEASLPKSFFTDPQSGGHPGIWGVDAWAVKVSRHASPGSHFDLVACSDDSGVPPNGGDIDTVLPVARPPHEQAKVIWLFWDTVPAPPPGSLPPIVHTAFSLTRLGKPVIHTSPSRLAGIPDATVVNFPTWLWISPGLWRTVTATASGGGYVATVWAIPRSVRWTSSWDFPSPADDPEHGTTLGPEVLDEVCNGPGTPFISSIPASEQQSYCTFEFADSSFGTRQALTATVTWSVYWALSSPSGIVGGEGHLGTVTTDGSLRLRVLQIESVISHG